MVMAMDPGEMTALNARGYKIALGLLGHFLVFSGSPHMKGFWVPDVGWVCVCGLAVEWNGKEYVI